MYKSLKKDDGSYSNFNFIRRGFQLVNPSLLLEHMSKCNGGVMMFFDYYYSLLRYGATVDDYFEYEFYKKTYCVRKEYITMLESRRIQKKMNTGDTHILNDKLRFNEYFDEFRNIRNFKFDKGQEAFLAFVKECGNEFLIKPITGYSGKGIQKISILSESDAIEKYRKLQDDDFLCEEIFVQHNELSKVHPYALNTIRICTVNIDNHIEIVFAGIRFGGSEAPVDNIHSGGVCCEIDIKSGIVIGKGVNRYGVSFVRHPMSREMFIGLKIPNWEMAIDTVKKAAQKCPTIRHIGWDCGIGEHSICLIEGNENANFDVPQTCCMRGFKPVYDEYLRKFEKH